MRFHIKTFNPLFWIVIVITVLLSYLYYLFFINFGELPSKILFAIIYCLMFFYFFYYKVKLSNDKEHQAYCEAHNVPKSLLLSEILPLQLCNVAYLIAPLGILFDVNACIGFSMLMAPFCAIVALLMPYHGLSDDSLLKPRIAGFYFTHLFILFMSIITWTTKNFVLNYQMAFETFALLFIFSAIAHIANLILHNTGLCKEVNYFFTMNPSTNFITKFFYKLIPIKWVYEFPIFVILLLLFCLIVFIYDTII